MADEGIGPRWYERPELIVLIIAGIVVPLVIFVLTWRCYWTPDFTISVSPIEASISQAGEIETTVTVKGVHGYEHPVSLRIDGRRSGITVAFDPSSGLPRPEYESTLKMTVTSDVLAGDYQMIIRGIGADGKERTCTYILTVEGNDGLRYVGSKNSDKYHYPSCHYVQQIRPENRIWFDSAAEAQASGYVPCKGCRPPVTD